MQKTRLICATAGAIMILGVVRPACRAETEPSTTPPETAASPATTPPSTAPTEVPITTDVQGKVPPDIVGRWLAVCQVKLQTGAARPITRLFEIREGREHLENALGRDIPTPANRPPAAAVDAAQP